MEFVVLAAFGSIVIVTILIYQLKELRYISFCINQKIYDAEQGGNTINKKFYKSNREVLSAARDIMKEMNCATIYEAIAIQDKKGK